MKGGNRCIIFDLDECLIHSIEQDERNYENMVMTNPKYNSIRSRLYSINIFDLNTPEGTGVPDRHWGIRRPHLNRLLDYCFKNFEFVCVWSAGHYKYVTEIVNQIFHGIGRPHLIFTWDNTGKLPNGNYYKPLQEMLNHPVLKDKVTMANTVFLDDRPENFITCKDNGIVIPKYKPKISEFFQDDVCLLQLEQFFRTTEFQVATDVRKVDKTQIFTKDLRHLPVLDSNVNPLVYATEIYESKPIYVENTVTPFTYSMPNLIYVH